MPYWLSREWWHYVLDDSRADHEYGPWNLYPTWLRWLTWNDDYMPNPFARIVNWCDRFICRWRGHPAGVYWYNPGALEPDMRCRGCGEEIG